MPFEQLDGERVFQVADAFADGRRGQEMALRRACQARFLNDGEEDLQGRWVYLRGQDCTGSGECSRCRAASRLVEQGGDLPAGAHTLKLVVVGTSGRPRVDVDGFIIER